MNPKIAYLLGNYPTVTETFVYHEIEKLNKQIPLIIFAQQKGNAAVPFTDIPVYYTPSSRIVSSLRDLLRGIYRHPRLFCAIILDCLRHRKTDRMKAFVRGVYFERIALKNRITHIHAHFATAPTRTACEMARMLHISFSFSAHAHDIYTSQPAEIADHIKNAAFVITCTKYNQNYLQNLVSSELRTKINLIYHGLPLGLWPFSESRRSLHRPLRLLTVGRIVEKKGYKYLLDALALLASKGHRITWIAVGDGDLRAQLESEACRRGISVDFVGWQSRQSILRLMHNSDLFVQPSVRTSDGNIDGIPNVLLEAMACGLPVIATAISGIPEIINQDNGVLVPEKSSEKLMDAILKLARDNRYREYLRLNARQCVEQFDIENSIRAIEHLFLRTTESTANRVES